MLPSPAFYDRARVSSLYVERAELVAEAAAHYRERCGIGAASTDAVRIAAFGIDAQIAFCSPGASLFVPGAVEDMQRTLDWLYGHLDRITQLCLSLDTHRVFQVFHPAWWADERGCHPAPFTQVTRADVESGRWRPLHHAAASLEYVRKLEAGGKHVLTIWPYHALLGGVGNALVPALLEASIFHSLVRTAPTHFVVKGTQALTESYSVLSPEVREVGGEALGAFDEALFETLMGFDRVYVFGQAKSHCVLATLRDMQERITQVDPKLAQKIFVLEDATSPVPAPAEGPPPAGLDFPRIAERAFADLRAQGMNIVKTTDPL